MKLKPPSLQHVARFYRPTADGVKKEFLKLARAHPPFSYEDLYKLAWDMAKGLQTYEAVHKAASEIKLEVKRNSYLRALRPCSVFFDELKHGYAIPIGSRSYSIGRGIQVPFCPPMLCGTAKGIVLPWLIFWTDNPLTGLQLQLFVSMVEDILKGEPDLDSAQLLIVDMSDAAIKKDGRPMLTSSADVPKLPASQMVSMLSTVVEGFELAKEELKSVVDRPVKRESVRDSVSSEDEQKDMFES